VLAYAVERLHAQVQPSQRHVGTPYGVVVPPDDVRAEGVLAGVASRAVTAVVAEGDRLGECHVQAQRSGDRGGHLCHLERVGEAGALVVVGKDEHLRLSGEPTERGVVQDAIAIAFEAGSELIGRLFDQSVARTRGPGRQGRQRGVFTLFAHPSVSQEVVAAACPRVGVCDPHTDGVVTRHGGHPTAGALGCVVVRCRTARRWVLLHGTQDTKGVCQVAWRGPMSAFVDECQLNVRAGDGGAGCVSFRREGPVAFGGPNGGDGGRGGHVWLIADHNVASLLAFRDHPHRRAENGVHGKGKDLHGRRGHDLDVFVPQGTVIRDLYTGEVLADLVHHGDRWMAVGGGRGGRGNARFLSNRRRAPSFAEQGEHGEERWLKLELKLMADVALVGFPNAGKSTLISRISAAKPKVADYPFTTLEPHLGVVRLDERTEFVVADIPGLIEGASEGRGLGHRFLRHVERARVLCIMIDLAATDGALPSWQIDVLMGELEAYRPELLERPRLIAGTKADVAEPAALAAWEHPVISGVTGEGVSDLVGRMAALVHDARQAEPVQEGMVLLRPEPHGAWVERLGEREFRVHGRAVERVVALNDITTSEARAYIDERLGRLGVPRLLARAGVREGDLVWIAGFGFDYSPEM